jgi:hypothetical protein
MVLLFASLIVIGRAPDAAADSTATGSTNANANSSANGQEPKEISALFDDITDIDKLRILNPLNLKPDEIDKIITLIKKAQTDYNTRLEDVAVPPIKSIAADIKTVRQKLLRGGAVPKDFDAKVLKLQQDYIQQHSAEDARILLYMCTEMKKILTPDQVQAAIDVTKANTKFSDKTTSDQYFNYYVLNTFIIYPRIIPLLQDMKNALSAGASIPQTPTLRVSQR